MREASDPRAKPEETSPVDGERARAVDARLAQLFRKQRHNPLMEELRKALRSHLLSREQA